MFDCCFTSINFTKIKKSYDLYNRKLLEDKSTIFGGSPLCGIFSSTRSHTVRPVDRTYKTMGHIRAILNETDKYIDTPPFMYIHHK